MKIKLSILFIAITGMFGCQTTGSQQVEDEPNQIGPGPDAIPLFNEENLDGWKQLGGEAKYRVENGEIIGTTVSNTPNSFLTTEKNYNDFILDVEILVDPSMNSGIQFRSNSNPDYRNGRVHGYQAEVDPSERAWSGGVFDEGRRGWLYPLEVNQEGRTAFKNGEWNHYHIEAIGNTIRIWVNGIPTSHLIDDMTSEGFIALQVHSIPDRVEPGSEVRWRNIMIQTENLQPQPNTDIFVVNMVPNTLSEQEKAQGWTMLFDGNTTNGWRGAHSESFPDVGWKVEDGILMVMESGGGEAEHGGDIVTEKEYDMFELQLDFKLTEGANSGIKYFVTENYGPSKGSAIGLEYQLLDDEKHPDAKKGKAGNRTLGSLYDLIPAEKGSRFVNDPGQWNHARLVVKGVRTDRNLVNGRPSDIDFTGAEVAHWLNHIKVLEYDRGTQMFQALVDKSKYEKFDDFGMWPKGRILLQDHGNQVHFRSIKIREL
ncbi:MAG: 3-keto-disaccharide hydrolase [Candidatus Cyclobacteriaceae bacterium M3_2C_046]